MPPSSRVRRCTKDDIPWLLELARNRYDGVNIESIGHWIDGAADNTNLLFIRTDHAAVSAAVFYPVYAPDKPKGGTLYIVSEKPAPWQVLALLKYARGWAKSKGCRGEKAFTIDSTTGYDIAPLALRLGAKPVSVTYALEIT